ncbi:L-histidine N(alpha)-methyltransferase [bacterium]|nr:L-histidine N(alpha)-methyltransferase [bacterium]
MKQYKVLTHQDLESVRSTRELFGLEVLLGLSKTEKSLPSRFFYDDEGSRLFQQITNLDDYYLTGAEHRILDVNKGKLAEMMGGESFNLIDLGSGDGRKTNQLLEEFIRRNLNFTYTPIDISEAAVQLQMKDLEDRFSALNVEGIVAEYFDGLLWHSHQSKERNFVLFLGSNIGNFHRGQARAFLRSVWNFLKPDDCILIGFDLKKNIERMVRAYNDTEGVTRAFNLNLLTRINRELEGNFVLSNWRHYANYDVFSGAMESYLVSKVEQEVYIREVNQRFNFLPFEPIHTEYSYKFLVSDIEQLAADTGFVIEHQLFDDDRDFVDSIWRVVKEVD